MFKLADRVKQVSLTAGSGLYIELQETFRGYQSFQDAIGDGNTTYYTIENGINFEIGIGTYTAGNNSLSRDEVLTSSNNNQRVNLDGNSVVFCSYPASKVFLLNNQGFATAPDGSFVGIQFPDGSIQGSTRPIRGYRTITQNTLLTNTDDIILADCSFSNIQATLPDASTMSGKTITFKLKSGPYILTVSAQSGDLIDGLPNFTIPHRNMSISVISDNSNWYIF